MVNDNTLEARQVRVTFLNTFDATFFSADVDLSQQEEGRLEALLSWLQEAGVILLPQPSTGAVEPTFQGMLSHLRGSVGAHIVEAALAAPSAPYQADRGTPIAIMPLWPFEAPDVGSNHRDVLLSSARLWGADLVVEALRVADPDSPIPLPSVRERFDRWMSAVGGGRDRVAVQPPGEPGWYVVAAVAAPR